MGTVVAGRTDRQREKERRCVSVCSSCRSYRDVTRIDRHLPILWYK